jgi:hypothetical protein
MHYCGDVRPGTYQLRILKNLKPSTVGQQGRILNIKWDDVREDRIKNKQVRFRFCNIPNIGAFIICRTASYIRKVARTSKDNYPKKFLGAWIKKHNNFAKAVSTVIPEKKCNYTTRAYSKIGFLKQKTNQPV